MTVCVAHIDSARELLAGGGFGTGDKWMTGKTDATDTGIDVSQEQILWRQIGSNGPRIRPNCIHEEGSERWLADRRIFLEEFGHIAGANPGADAIVGDLVIIQPAVYRVTAGVGRGVLIQTPRRGG